MSNFDINDFLRPHLKEIIPYSSARDEFSGTAKVFLDANENPYNTNLNRYPDPYQKKLKFEIGKIKNVHQDNLFIGNGSDEAIDLILRAFGNPGIDKVMITPPTYGMYEVSSELNNLKVIKINLDSEFNLDMERVLVSCESSKIIFLCSPNNPTGNKLRWSDIEKIIAQQSSIVVVDEAYIDFSEQKSWTTEINNYQNLIVLQTLSKAWGLAGLRIGIAFANMSIINILNKIKPPYNISEIAQQRAIKIISNQTEYQRNKAEILSQRQSLIEKFNSLRSIKKVFPSDANFLLIRVENALELYNYLINNEVVVRNRSNLPLCEDTLRITVGTPSENKKLVNLMENWSAI